MSFNIVFVLSQGLHKGVLEGTNNAANDCKCFVAMILAYHCLITKLKGKDKEEKAAAIKELRRTQQNTYKPNT